MKTLEDRLRDAGERFNHETDPTGSLWVALHDVLAIVADAPRYTEADLIMARIGELERIKKAFLPGHNGLQAYVNSWLVGYRRDLAALSTSTQGVEQTPTNSPSEGIRATPDLPDSIHRNQGKE